MNLTVPTQLAGKNSPYKNLAESIDVLTKEDVLTNRKDSHLLQDRACKGVR
jgi:hypothetical protein